MGHPNKSPTSQSVERVRLWAATHPAYKIPIIQHQPTASSHPAVEPPGLQESMTPIIDLCYRGWILSPQGATGRHRLPQAARHSAPADPGILLKPMKIIVFHLWQPSCSVWQHLAATSLQESPPGQWNQGFNSNSPLKPSSLCVMEFC